MLDLLQNTCRNMSGSSSHRKGIHAVPALEPAKARLDMGGSVPATTAAKSAAPCRIIRRRRLTVFADVCRPRPGL